MPTTTRPMPAHESSKRWDKPELWSVRLDEYSSQRGTEATAASV
jgi:hypothetical protein